MGGARRGRLHNNTLLCDGQVRRRTRRFPSNASAPSVAAVSVLQRERSCTEPAQCRTCCTLHALRRARSAIPGARKACLAARPWPLC